MYYHELSGAIREYLRQEGLNRGTKNLLSMLYCALVDVGSEIAKEDESKTSPTD